MSRPRSHCGTVIELAYSGGIMAECFLPLGHGGPHVSDGTKALTVWSALADDEQHESDDGKDDEDRPQHGSVDTPSFEPVHGDVTDSGGTRVCVRVALDTYEYPSGPVTIIPAARWGALLASQITPEIQAVLDAALDWQRWHARNYPGSPVMPSAEGDLWIATDAYLASIRPKRCENVFAPGLADPYICRLFAGHEGRHRDEGDNWSVEWT